MFAAAGASVEEGVVHVPAEAGNWQVQSMSEVPSISTSQSAVNFTVQSSFISSAAATHTCPKLSQYLSQRPP